MNAKEASMAHLFEIEGIGEVYTAKLQASGVSRLEELLEAGADKKGRKALAKDANISEKLILNWVNRADLVRVKGISTQYAALLHHSGVDTVPDLATRNPENLLAAITRINEEKKFVRKLPTLVMVQDWISHALDLPRCITY